MRTIYLHGALGKKYGVEFHLAVDTAGEAVRALCTNFPDMIGDFRDGAWTLVRGKDPIGGFSLDEVDVAGLKLGEGDLHILPALAGAKDNGAMKVILGVALIGISFGFSSALAAPIAPSLLGATTWGNAFGQIGLMLVLSGVSQMLAPEKEDQKKDNSFLFSGPTNMAQQGYPVPVVYGEVITGGILISAGIDIEEVSVETVTNPTVPSFGLGHPIIQPLSNIGVPGVR